MQISEEKGHHDSISFNTSISYTLCVSKIPIFSVFKDMIVLLMYIVLTFLKGTVCSLHQRPRLGQFLVKPHSSKELKKSLYKNC